MKKTTKIVLMAAFSYLVIEDPKFCEDLGKVLSQAISKKKVKK